MNGSGARARLPRSGALLLAGALAAGTVVAGAGTGAAAGGAAACTGSGPLPYTCAQPGDLIDVRLGELHPTQAVLGFDQVFYKLGRYGSDRDEAAGGVNKRFDDWCETNGQEEAATAAPAPGWTTCRASPAPSRSGRRRPRRSSR